MKKGKLLTLLPLMAMILTGCNNAKSSFSFDENKVFNIGVCQIVAHPALDKATDGFKKSR